MGIRITPSDTFRAKVEYYLKDEAGKDEKQEFLGHFKRLTAEGVKELSQSGKSDSEMVREVLTGWTAKDLATGEDVPYTPEIRDALLSQPAVAGTIILRYFETCGGARQKN